MRLKSTHKGICPGCGKEVVMISDELLKYHYKENESEIMQLYLTWLTNFDPYSFDSVITKIKKFEEVTKIKPSFDQVDMNIISAYAIRKLRQIGRLSQIFELEEILPSPEVMSSVCSEILISSIDKGDKTLFTLASEKMKELELSFNSEDVTRLIRRYISEDPRKVVSIVKFINAESQNNETIVLLKKTVLDDPWISAFSRLEKLQGIVSNVDNDPWVNEFKPFIRNGLKLGLISLDKEEDAELIVSFIEIMGMNNIPEIFKVYIDCQRNRDLDRLSQDTLKLCTEFGIKTHRKDETWRFKDSLELFNELSSALKGIRSDLLTDKIPDGLTTELGLELFNRIKGSSQFERDDSLPVIIHKWNNTIERDPSLGELPAGFKETTIKVPLLKHKVEVPRDQTEQVVELLSSQEVTDAYLPLIQSWEAAANNGFVGYLDGVMEDLSEEETKIKELLSNSPDEIQKVVDIEKDPKIKQGLIKKLKALQNPKGRQGIERQANVLNDVIKEIDKILNLLDSSPHKMEDYVVVLESLNKLDGKVSLQKVIRDLSAIHMRDYVMNQGYKQLVRELLVNINDIDVATSDSVYLVHKISKDYIEEHYLHHLQDSKHTEHPAFSPELLEKLNLVWQQQLDKQTGYMPITILKNKLDKILGVYSGKTTKEVPVTMMPVSGLLHIYSGDLGDSCHTSQHDSMAKGQFPNLRSWIYVTNKGKPNEELRGSVLAIQAEKLDDTPVLVVRANNPSENFVQSVDSDTFIVNVLKEAIETAKRVRTDRIKNNKSLPAVKLRQMVTIPMDRRGSASTNRQGVNDVYRKRFVDCKKVALKNTAETNFNGYNVHSPDSHTATVVIWEIDANGNEHWHGDWETKS
ncbi:hypothetical protein H0W91_01645 [Patescibacteria group bacterium]|nr:hypothetical protein [Patescibacteria group bacterium]